MGKGSAPKPPDPQELARIQTQTNLDTAAANNRMGMVDQITPWGTLTYETIYDQPQTATVARPAPQNPGPMFRPDGSFMNPLEAREAQRPSPSRPTTTTTSVPRYRATTTLAPEQQRLLDLSNQAQTNFGQLAVDQSARLSDLLGIPVNLNNEATEARLMELGRSRLDPEMDRRRESLRTTLANQGIKEGSEAFDRAMMRNMEGENDAFNQLLLTGRQQAVSEALAERNQPINEITALMSGSQVTQPQFRSVPTAQMPTVDTAGLEMQGYQNELDRFNSQPNLMNTLGGLFGLASSAISPTSFLGRQFPMPVSVTPMPRGGR